MKTKKQILIIIFTLLFAASFVLAEDNKPVEKKEAESHIGTIKKIEEAGKYIYLQIDEEGKEVWLATMPTFFSGKLSEGDRIEYMGGDLMAEFKSTVLNRTFDSILFVTRIRSLKEGPSEAEQAATQNDPHKKIPGIKKKVSAPVKGEIKRAEEGRNIEEIFSERDQLNNKEVILRGKVMKVNKNILAQTWVTLQDGTGSAPDNKIIAVTKDAVNVGEILTVRGILKTDVNLGSGYKYKALIDEAKLTK